MAGHVIKALLVLTLVPLEGAAQTLASPSAASSLRASIAAIADSHSPVLSAAPQAQRPARARVSRRAWIALGTGIGFGGGLVFGEYYFGRRLDLPHGPDMMIGGAIGAGAGALVAWLTTRNGRPAQSGPITITKPDVQSCDSP